jgi:hypothetical protein
MDYMSQERWYGILVSRVRCPAKAAQAVNLVNGQPTPALPSPARTLSIRNSHVKRY